MNGRDAIQPILGAYFCNAVESDGLIKFFRSGMDPVEHIPEDDLSAFEEVRQQSAEIPNHILVKHLDPDLDFQVGTQDAKIPGATDLNSHTVDFSIVMSGDLAKQVAEKILASIWENRTTYKWTTTKKYLYLDCEDVITVQVGNTLVTLRITKMVEGDTLQFEGFSEDQAVYNNTATANSGIGLGTALPREQYDTRFIPMRLPMLRDIDQRKEVGSLMYYGFAGYNRKWKGGSLFKRSVFLNDHVQTTKWGYVSGRLPSSSDDFNLVDRETQLKVVMERGELESTDFDGLMDQVNLAAIGDEVIAFQNADPVANEPGAYIISNILTR